MGAKKKIKKLTEEQEELLAGVMDTIQEMVDELHEAGPITREFSLALTKLEEADMWTQRGFEVLGYSTDSKEDEDEDEDEEDEVDDADEEEAK